MKRGALAVLLDRARSRPDGNLTQEEADKLISLIQRRTSDA